MIKLIWAMDKNSLIGVNNRLPWRVKEDLIYYKEKTFQKTVICGKATYESLKGYYKDKPLPYSKIYVATRNTEYVNDEVTVINNVEEFFKNNKEELFVIGGSQIYELALNYADVLYISIIKGDYIGDTYFPKFSLDNFKLSNEKETDLVVYKTYERT